MVYCVFKRTIFDNEDSYAVVDINSKISDEDTLLEY